MGGYSRKQMGIWQGIQNCKSRNTNLARGIQNANKNTLERDENALLPKNVCHGTRGRGRPPDFF
jgi:hypothetical protein